MFENEDILKNDAVIQEEVETIEKVELKSANNSKYTKKTPAPKTNIKECDVLVYNAAKKYAIISLNGCGYTLENITENPGNKLSIRISGTFGSSNFKLEVCK